MAAPKYDNIGQALAAVQAEIPAIKRTKTAKAGSYSYDYADLGDILEVVLPILSKHGIAVSQPMSVGETGDAHLETVLMLGDSEIRSAMPLPTEGLTAQQLGSWITYLRRYSLSALLSIATESDDDGQAAAGGRKEAKPPAASSIPRASKPIGPPNHEIREGQQPGRPLPPPGGTYDRPIGFGKFKAHTWRWIVEGDETRDHAMPGGGRWEWLSYMENALDTPNATERDLATLERVRKCKQLISNFADQEAEKS